MKKVVNHSVGYYLKKFNRILVWSTLVLFMIFVVSGYGITNQEVISELTGGILNRSLSLNLHMTLALPVLALLMIHVLIELRFTLIRWGVKDGMMLNVFVIGLGVFCGVLLVLMDKAIF
jgi:thiosulfate reductase cytochrome b subunit